MSGFPLAWMQSFVFADDVAILMLAVFLLGFLCAQKLLRGHSKRAPSKVLAEMPRVDVASLPCEVTPLSLAVENPSIEDNVVTADLEKWSSKVRMLLSAGADQTFFVIDFDRTTTRCFLETGAKSLDCHDILASCPKITKECKRKMEALMDKYYPIEIDAHLSRDEKVPHMVEWYTLVNSLLMDQGLTRDDVRQAVHGCRDFRLRHGAQELFQLAEQRGIPVVVLSAGLGNVIEEVLLQRMPHSNGSTGRSWGNVRVLSNTLLWDASGNHRGFTEPLIHMFNKGLVDAPSDIKEMLRGRRHGVLCGDGLGDLTMAAGHDVDNLLKFGFLNEKIPERLGQYCSSTAFDQVVLGDGSFEPLLKVLRRL